MILVTQNTLNSFDRYEFCKLIIIINDAYVLPFQYHIVLAERTNKFDYIITFFSENFNLYTEKLDVDIIINILK